MTNIVPFIFIVLMIIGVFAVFIPLVPAMLYMYIVAVIFAVIDNFEKITAKNLLTLGVIFVASVLVDWLSGVLGARIGGASKKSILYGLLGMVVGFFILPPFGGFIGIFAGVLLSELILGKGKEKAVKAAASSLMGVLTGLVINLALAVAFLILFIVFMFN